MGLASAAADFEAACRDHPFKREEFMDLELGFQPTFHRSQFGGGIVKLEYDITYWSVMVALNRTVKTYLPLGFDRWEWGGNITVIASMVKATHRVRETPMPAAPSPLFSVEPGSAPTIEVLLRFSKRQVVTAASESFCRSMTDFGCPSEVINVEESANDLIPACSLPRTFSVARIRLAPTAHPLLRLLAFAVYAGIAVHSQCPFLWVVSFCGPFKTKPVGARRACEFPTRARPTRTADDW